MSSLVTLPVLKKHLGGIQTKLDFNTVLPFIKLCEHEFRKDVGSELYAYICDLDPEAGSIEEDLKYAAQGCVAWAAYDMAMPHLKLRVGDMGIMKNSPTNTIAITKWEYVDTREANMEMRDLFLENFWAILEIVNPEEWTGSDAYKKRQRLFIRSASEISAYAPLVGSNNRFFQKLALFIARVESEYLTDAVTLSLWLDLKSKWASEAMLTDPVELELLEHIRRPLAYLALYEAYPYLPVLVDQEGTRQIRRKDGTREEDIAERAYRQAQRRQLWQDAQLYLGRLHKFLSAIASPEQFPSYYNFYVAPGKSEDDFTYKPHVLF